MAANDTSSEEFPESEDDELWEAERRRRLMYATVAIVLGLAAVVGIVYGVLTLA